MHLPPASFHSGTRAASVRNTSAPPSRQTHPRSLLLDTKPPVGVTDKPRDGSDFQASADEMKAPPLPPRPSMQPRPSTSLHPSNSDGPEQWLLAQQRLQEWTWVNRD